MVRLQLMVICGSGYKTGEVFHLIDNFQSASIKCVNECIILQAPVLAARQQGDAQTVNE